MDQIIPQMHVELQQEMVLPGHEKGQEGFLEVVSTKQRLEGRMHRTGAGKTLNTEGNPKGSEWAGGMVGGCPVFPSEPLELMSNLKQAPP